MTLDHVATELWSLAGTALVHGTLLAIIAAALAATLLRRARPALHAALWTVVLLKFVAPIGPGARYSLASLYARLDHPSATALVAPFTAPVATPTAAVVARPAAEHPLQVATMVAWAMIALALGARQLIRYRGARRAAFAAAAAPSWLDRDVVRLARQVGVGRPITVRIAKIVAPYVIGVVRPVIVVPTRLIEDRPRLHAALVHELAHVRRFDGAVRVLQWITTSLFFFWPVIHWINRRIDLAREQACDAYAIELGPLAATDYARMLVAVAKLRAPAAALGLGGSHLARRVDALRRPVHAGLGIVGAVAVAGFGVVGLSSAATAADPRAVTTARVCVFTPEVAAEIMTSYPEADVDGDGALTRAEVCDFQQAIRRRFVDEALGSSTVDRTARDRLAGALPMSTLPAQIIDEASPLASDQLCCNCSAGAARGAVSGSFSSNGSPFGPTAELNPAIATCSRGVDQ